MPLGIPHSAFLAWPEDDQDKALAYTRDQAERCTGCGTKRREWDADPFAYVGHIERCPGCEAIAMEHDNVHKDDTKGVRIGLVTRAMAERIAQAGDMGTLGGVT